MSWMPQAYLARTQSMYAPAQTGTSSIIGDISNLLGFLLALPQMVVMMVMMLIMSMLTRVFA